MDRQHNSMFFFNSSSQPQRGESSIIDDEPTPLMSRQYMDWGGEPMQITDSNGSTNSKMSRVSYVSATTASSPITTYGSYETNSYMAGFNQTSSTSMEGLYTADGIDNSLNQMYLKNDSQESKISSATTVHTPSSLGWMPDKDPFEYYSCIMPKDKNKKVPYLELRADFVVDEFMPFRVYLDEPINCPKGKSQCMYPGCHAGYKRRYYEEEMEEMERKKKIKNGSSTHTGEQDADEEQESLKPKGPPPVFSRPADRDRHYSMVHSENKPKYPCDFPNCGRGADRPFGRKDHLRDHLRDYHHQDLGSAKRVKRTDKIKISDEEIEAKWQHDQPIWVSSRRISRKDWRCNKCLTKTLVVTNGWICSNPKCTQPCEEWRIQMRLNRQSGAGQTKERHSKEEHTEQTTHKLMDTEQSLSEATVHTEERQSEFLRPGEHFSWQNTTEPDYCVQCGNSNLLYGELTCGFCQSLDGPSDYNMENYDYNLTLPVPLFPIDE